MVACEVGRLFLKVVDCSGEVKDKDFIASLLNDAIEEVGDDKFVVQILTDNATNCKAAGELIEGRYPHIFWTPCIFHTLNLALKNICNAKNVSNNEEVYDECHWITEVHGDALFVKNYIMNHSMRLAIFRGRLVGGLKERKREREWKYPIPFDVVWFAFRMISFPHFKV
ncbi:uncharacterized protein LOC130802133 isoform X1 [Amaranthus tricolor]|uniref:uncharacterized protein LOC130802133 isoform X1 n=1 Tax=Amaranthus tricolor TaxID=29722 RepID=UPI00258FE23D|nr:uncharacterized protein LOC130802133 isoform X1 [Amaranthus tricolor]